MVCTVLFHVNAPVARRALRLLRARRDDPGAPGRARGWPGHDRPAGDARGRRDGRHAPVRRPLADRGRALGVARAGAALVAAGAAAHLVAEGTVALAPARLTIGAGEGALFTGALAYVLEAAPTDRRGRLIGHFGLSMWGGLARVRRSPRSSPRRRARAERLWLAATAGVAALVLTTAGTRRRVAAPRATGASAGHAAPAGTRPRALPPPTATRRGGLPHPLTRRSHPRVSSRERRGSPASSWGWRRSDTGRSTRSPCCRPAPGALAGVRRGVPRRPARSGAGSSTTSGPTHRDRFGRARRRGARGRRRRDRPARPARPRRCGARARLSRARRVGRRGRARARARHGGGGDDVLLGRGDRRRGSVGALLVSPATLRPRSRLRRASPHWPRSAFRRAALWSARGVARITVL